MVRTWDPALREKCVWMDMWSQRIYRGVQRNVGDIKKGRDIGDGRLCMIPFVVAIQVVT